MKKHYETHVEDTDKLISVAGPILEYKSWYEQMAANPVWVDKTGNGYDLQLKNFSWKGMSRVGGYEMNFNSWRNNVSGIPDISMSTTTTSDATSTEFNSLITSDEWSTNTKDYDI